MGRGYNVLRFFLSAFSFILLTAGSVTADEDLSKVLEGLRKNYGTLPGLSLDYSREVISKTMSMLGESLKGDKACGRMFFKPPFYLKLEQASPSKETVLSDENTLWWHIPNQKKAYKYSAKEFGKELQILSNIFRGLIRIEERFQATQMPDTDQKDYRIALEPTDAWQNIEKIILTISKEFTIKQIAIHYQLGSTTLFALKNIKPGEFDNDFFHFKAPEGTLVIEEKI